MRVKEEIKSLYRISSARSVPVEPMREETSFPKWLFFAGGPRDLQSSTLKAFEGAIFTARVKVAFSIPRGGTIRVAVLPTDSLQLESGSFDKIFDKHCNEERCHNYFLKAQSLLMGLANKDIFIRKAGP